MITVKTFQARREKLAAFLLALPKSSFDVFTWTWPNDSSPKHPACGTAVCAIGWCPTVFPKHWVLGKSFRIPKLRVMPPVVRQAEAIRKLYLQAAIFFGLTQGAAYEVFRSIDSYTLVGPKRKTAKQVVKALLKAEVTSG